MTTPGLASIAGEPDGASGRPAIALGSPTTARGTSSPQVRFSVSSADGVIGLPLGTPAAAATRSVPASIVARGEMGGGMSPAGGGRAALTHASPLPHNNGRLGSADPDAYAVAASGEDGRRRAAGGAAAPSGTPPASSSSAGAVKVTPAAGVIAAAPILALPGSSPTAVGSLPSGGSAASGGLGRQASGGGGGRGSASAATPAGAAAAAPPSALSVAAMAAAASTAVLPPPRAALAPPVAVAAAAAVGGASPATITRVDTDEDLLQRGVLWEIDRSELSLDTAVLIGRGSFGEVLRTKWRGTPVAVKRLHIDASTSALQELRHEIAVMSHMHHPRVVQFLGACTRSAPALIVYELLAGGTLASLLESRQGKPLPVHLAGRFALDCAQALRYLHEHKPTAVLHRDLKPSNLLIDGSGHCKIGDFGLAKVVDRIRGTVGDGLPVPGMPGLAASSAGAAAGLYRHRSSGHAAAAAAAAAGGADFGAAFASIPEGAPTPTASANVAAAAPVASARGASRGSVIGAAASGGSGGPVDGGTASSGTTGATATATTATAAATTASAGTLTPVTTPAAATPAAPPIPSALSMAPPSAPPPTPVLAGAAAASLGPAAALDAGAMASPSTLRLSLTAAAPAFVMTPHGPVPLNPPPQQPVAASTLTVAAAAAAAGGSGGTGGAAAVPIAASLYAAGAAGGGGTGGVMIAQPYVMTGGTGSYRYMAPEVFRHQSYDTSVDIYAFACVCYYLFTGSPPFADMAPLEAAKAAAVDHLRPTFTLLATVDTFGGTATTRVSRRTDPLPREVELLIRQCWHPAPNKRPTAQQICDALELLFPQDRILARGILLTDDGATPSGGVRTLGLAGFPGGSGNRSTRSGRSTKSAASHGGGTGGTSSGGHGSSSLPAFARTILGSLRAGSVSNLAGTGDAPAPDSGPTATSSSAIDPATPAHAAASRGTGLSAAVVVPPAHAATGADSPARSSGDRARSAAASRTGPSEAAVSALAAPSSNSRAVAMPSTNGSIDAPTPLAPATPSAATDSAACRCTIQ